ncbi:hypothetical protein [Streptomyces celluloflavus]|uniref:hypothetical protein n=1 Tax=Streptomyces celluloflavus TaxID=58344 RepID=UPI0034600680|nr:hypothetical protein OG717_28635 [Streptomyces celluloflavus]
MITTEDPGKWNVPNQALTRRRTLLAGAALGGAALLAGCSGEPERDRPADPSAADRLRTGAARDSTALLARYDATLAAHPALAARLRPLRTEVARHAEAFGDRSGTPAPGGTPSGTPAPGTKTPAPGPAHTAAPPAGAAVPQDEKAARSALADAERRLSDTRTKALTAAPPELARLLASVAAAGAAHAYLLTAAEA